MTCILCVHLCCHVTQGRLWWPKNSRAIFLGFIMTPLTRHLRKLHTFPVMQPKKQEKASWYIDLQNIGRYIVSYHGKDMILTCCPALLQPLQFLKWVAAWMNAAWFLSVTSASISLRSTLLTSSSASRPSSATCTSSCTRRRSCCRWSWRRRSAESWSAWTSTRPCCAWRSPVCREPSTR